MAKQTVVHQVPAKATQKIRNKTANVINAGKIRFAPRGTPTDTIEIPISKISEGLKRLLASPSSGLEIIS